LKARLVLWGKRVLLATCSLTVLMAMLPAQTYALFGIPEIVFDPSAVASLGHIWNEDISNGAKLVKSYQFAVQMARQIQHPQRMLWNTIAMRAANDYTQNAYGETILWPNMMNGMPALAAGAWQQSTQAIQPMPMYFNFVLTVVDFWDHDGAANIATKGISLEERLANAVTVIGPAIGVQHVVAKEVPGSTVDLISS